MNKLRLRALLLAGITLLLLGTAPAGANPDIEATILHSGLNVEENVPIILLDKGSEQGIVKGETYQMVYQGRDLGKVGIRGTLPESAAGTFLPAGGETPPEVGAVVRLELVAPWPEAAAATTEADLESISDNNTGTSIMKHGYKVGSGDVLKINAWPKNTLPETVTVRPDGTISLPFVGTLPVENTTVFEIGNGIQERMSRDFKQPWVEVSVSEYRSKIVRILGEVITSRWRVSGPGEYPLKEDMRLLEFLSIVGGLTDNADIRNIKLVRKDGSEKIIDLNKVIENPDSEENILLQGGNIIYVPTAVASKIRVMLLGRLNRQGVFYLDKEHSRLMDAISETGGLLQDAALDRVYVIRDAGGERQTITLDISRLAAGETDQDFQLQGGDMVYMPARGQQKRDALDRFNDVIRTVIPSLNLLLLIDRLED